MTDMNLLNGTPEEEQPAAEQQDEFAAFIDGIEETAEADPAQCVTIRTSAGGNPLMVPVTEPTSVAEVMRRSGLFLGGAVEYWVNANRVDPSFMVSAGATITAVGQVKGGAC